MRRYRVSKKAGQDQEAQSHKESTAYKYIPCHLHIISFEQVVFCKQRLNSEPLFLYIILKRHECLLCKCILLNVYGLPNCVEFVNDYELSQN